MDACLNRLSSRRRRSSRHQLAFVLDALVAVGHDGRGDGAIHCSPQLGGFGRPNFSGFGRRRLRTMLVTILALALAAIGLVAIVVAVERCMDLGELHRD